MYELAVNASDAGWVPLDFPGVTMKTLWEDAESGAMAVMTRMEPGATIPKHMHTKADETVLVVDGDFIENGTPFGIHAFFFGPRGTTHGPHTTSSGCVVLTTFSSTLDFVLVE